MDCFVADAPRNDENACLPTIYLSLAE